MTWQLPGGFALVIRGGFAPVNARLPLAWKDRAYRRARRVGRAVALLTPAAPAAELGQVETELLAPRTEPPGSRSGALMGALPEQPSATAGDVPARDIAAWRR